MITDGNEQSVDRQLGETIVELKYIRDKIDKLTEKVDQMQKDLEQVKIEQATAQGGRKALATIRAIVSAAIGAFASLVTAWAILGGKT